MRIYIFRPLFSSYYVAYHSISRALICGGQRIQTLGNVVRLQIKFEEMITSKKDIFPAKSIYYRILYVVDLIFFAPDKKYIKVKLEKKKFRFFLTVARQKGILYYSGWHSCQEKLARAYFRRLRVFRCQRSSMFCMPDDLGNLRFPCLFTRTEQG